MFTSTPHTEVMQKWSSVSPLSSLNGTIIFCPGAPLTNFNEGEGGSDRGSYFIPKKIATSEFVYPKKVTTFLAYT